MRFEPKKCLISILIEWTIPNFVQICIIKLVLKITKTSFIVILIFIYLKNQVIGLKKSKS